MTEMNNENERTVETAVPEAEKIAAEPLTTETPAAIEVAPPFAGESQSAPEPEPQQKAAAEPVQGATGKTVAALILALTGTTFGIMGITGILGLAAGIVGLIFSIKEKKTNPCTMATIAFAFSIVAIVVSAIGFVACIACVGVISAAGVSGLLNDPSLNHIFYGIMNEIQYY